MIYLLRHGEVEGASTRRFIGHLDVPLSAEGERQCAVQAERLRATKLTEVFSSDIGRSERRSSGPPARCRTSSTLREMDMGGGTG